MKAMILAAGRGTRMAPLTDHVPKPMIKVAGKPLIEHQVERLVAAGFTDIIINHAYLGEQIEAHLKDGKQLGCRIQYSAESQALETAGGIMQALPLLGDAPFLVVNGDVWLDFDYRKLNDFKLNGLAHLVLVNNPAFHEQGDFYLCLNENGPAMVSMDNPNLKNETKFTFSGLSILDPKLFLNYKPGILKLLLPLKDAMKNKQVSGELYKGYWLDVGTPARLDSLKSHLEKTVNKS